jgi:O-methyltransferase involved in polyketide biosynthesis
MKSGGPGEVQKGISGTAFMVNCSRSKREDISRDVYAKLWVTPESLVEWDALAESVYAHDDINLSVRNRFFLERLQRFIVSNRDPVFVDVASGFDNYPFLVDGRCTFLEFDLPHVMAYKKERVARWMEEGKLPRREVGYHSIDLNDADERKRLRRDLKAMIGGRPSIITLQGITYYLGRRSLDDILSVFREAQEGGSLVLFDYWKPDAMENATMQRLKKHLQVTYGYTNLEWNLFDDAYIDRIPGYRRIESDDIAGLERMYSPTRELQGEDKIPGCYAVLMRGT